MVRVGHSRCITMKIIRRLLCRTFLLNAIAVFSSTVLAQAPSTKWSLDCLDQVLASAQPGQRTARVGDMEILLSNLRAWRDQLAGTAVPLSAFDGTTPTWTDGIVYYAFVTDGT